MASSSTAEFVWQVAVPDETDTSEQITVVVVENVTRPAGTRPAGEVTVAFRLTGEPHAV